MNEISWLIPLLPLAGAAVIGLLLKNFNLTMNRLSKPVAFISMSCIGAAGILSAALTSENQSNLDATEQLFNIGSINLQLGYRVDHSGSVLLTVVSISALILMLLTHREMAGKKGYVWCFTCLGFFSSALLGLVMSPNLAELFLFWILLGFCSQQLIIIWSYSTQEDKPGAKFSLLDRLGDLGLFIGTIDLLKLTGSLDFKAISSSLSTAIQTNKISNNGAILLCLLLLLSPLIKSAQLPLHIWQAKAKSLTLTLPGIIHDIMLISAGLLLVIRVDPIIDAGAIALRGTSLLQSLA